MNRKFLSLSAFLILAIAIYFPIFGHLDTLPVRLWDESRQAINAYEMNRDGNWIVTHFDGKPDLWNTKPPLLVWMQVGFMKCVGVNELALRLPSAMAAFLTCLLLLFFSMRYIRDYWFGFIAVMVLVTSQGYIGEHGSRTGDYDALVTLFITATCLSLFLYVENRKIKYMHFFFAALALGVLSKGITVLLCMPAALIYVIVRNRFTDIVKNKYFYLDIGLFLFITLGYYVLRESLNPGYLEAVKNNELGGRYFNVIEGNSGDFGYYYQNLLKYRFAEWIVLVPCGLIVGLCFKNKNLQRLTLFATLMVFVYFLVISISRTKLEWYDTPLFPFLAILVSMFIYFIFLYLKNAETLHSLLIARILPFVFLFLLCVGPYTKITDKTFLPRDSAQARKFYELDYFLKDAVNGKYKVDNCYFLVDGYNPHYWFYIRVLQDKGVKTGYKDWTHLSPSDKVIAYQDNVKNYIQSHYNTEIMGGNGNIVTYKITDHKTDEKNAN